MQGAIVYQWTRPVPGREAEAGKLFRDATAYAEKAVAEGRITDYAWYISGQGGLNFMVVRGELETLMANTGDPELVELGVRSGLVQQGYSWSFCATGETAQAQVALFEQQVAQLT